VLNVILLKNPLPSFIIHTGRINFRNKDGGSNRRRYTFGIFYNSCFLPNGSQGGVAGILDRLRGGQLSNCASTERRDNRYFSPPKSRDRFQGSPSVQRNTLLWANSRSVRVGLYLHLVSSVRMRGVIPLMPLYAFMTLNKFYYIVLYTIDLNLSPT
jgi:hypothetical protein